MKLAILGGTGKMGLALGKRALNAGHEVAIGSRNAERAAEAVSKLAGPAIPMSNPGAAHWCDIAILTIPYAGHHALLQSLGNSMEGKILIDTTVPVDPANMFEIRTDSGKSATEESASLLSATEVYAAFQTVSHRKIRRIEVTQDILVAGGPAQKAVVMELIRSMNLRPIDAGPLEVAGLLERMTLLLLSINKQNRVKDSSFTIVGV
jgi:NADPH-dependent F420 reductase